MSSVETGQMSAVETGQMSAAETGQMSAVETRQMSSIQTGQSPVSIVGICHGTSGFFGLLEGLFWSSAKSPEKPLLGCKKTPEGFSWSPGFFWTPQWQGFFWTPRGVFLVSGVFLDPTRGFFGL